jgi:Mg2+ and Co2+ transporter CorA
MRKASDAWPAADFDMINAEFGLHELAIEDALHERQHPKLDRYPHHMFISAYTVDLGATPDLAIHGVGFLLYELLDVLVDRHFAIVQQLDDSIEELQDLLFSENRKQIHAVQRGTARPGHDHPGDQHHYPGQANEPDHEGGNRLGCDHRGPTAITGFYGQSMPYPGFGKQSGFIFSTAIIIAKSGLLYLTFKRKDWLSGLDADDRSGWPLAPHRQTGKVSLSASAAWTSAAWVRAWG